VSGWRSSGHSPDLHERTMADAAIVVSDSEPEGRPHGPSVEDFAEKIGASKNNKLWHCRGVHANKSRCAFKRACSAKKMVAHCLGGDKAKTQQVAACGVRYSPGERKTLQSLWDASNARTEQVCSLWLVQWWPRTVHCCRKSKT
jgi:hypothetical protein